MKGYVIEKYNNMTGAYTCHRLVEEAHKKGVILDIIGVHDCYLTPKGVANTSINLEKRDFVINRYKWGAVKNVLNALALRSYNRVSAYDIYKNKFEQLNHLRSEEFSIPDYLLATSQIPFKLLEERLGLPFVVKALENSMGREVMLIHNEDQYRAFQNASPLDREWLFEEFIAYSFGRDLRLFAIRGKAIACMMRKSKGDFRANVALGATVKPVEITPALEKIAYDICMTTGLDFVGIDLMFSPSGYVLCEINVMPGLEGIESASGVNIAGHIIDTIIQDFEEAHISCF